MSPRVSIASLSAFINAPLSSITPKNTRSKKRRHTFGSDVEEYLEDGLFAPAEVDEVQVVEVEEREVRHSGRTARITPVIADEEEEEAEVYNPSLERQHRHRRRAEQRSRRREEHEFGPVEWLTIDDRRYSPYLPQLWDIVAYFPEGHRTFLEKEPRRQFHEDIPSYVTEGASRRSQQSHLLAQVVEVQFCVNEAVGRPWCQMTLVPVDEAAYLSSSDEGIAGELRADPMASDRFVLRYYDMADIPDFLILACRYTWSLDQDYHAGQLVRVIYGHEESYSGRITRVGPRRRSAWQCYTVQWLTLDDPPEDCSPWELEPVIEESDDNGSFRPYRCHEAIPEATLRVLVDGLGSIMANRRAQYLVDPVDYRSFPDYTVTVPYPMHLDLMRSRLENGFYRRMEAFLWDAQLITTNTLVYNEPDSDIVRDAAAVYQMIEALVRRAQRPSRHAAVNASARQEMLPSPLSPPPRQAVSASSPTTAQSARKRARLVESSDSEEEHDEDVRRSGRRHSQRHSTRAPRDSSPPASTLHRRVSSRLRG